MIKWLSLGSHFVSNSPFHQHDLERLLIVHHNGVRTGGLGVLACSTDRTWSRRHPLHCLVDGGAGVRSNIA